MRNGLPPAPGPAALPAAAGESPAVIYLPSRVRESTAFSGKRGLVDMELVAMHQNLVEMRLVHICTRYTSVISLCNFGMVSKVVDC